MAEVAGWLDVLGCPGCRGPLRMDGESLRCPACTRRFPVQDGVPSLVHQEDVAALANSSRRYRQARLQEGWCPLSPEQALALPYGAPPGYPALYWQVRRQSYRALMSFLSLQGSAAGPVADLGAGTGWLAHRLAEAGYRVLAVEASLDRHFGLGGATVYLAPPLPRFLPVQGDLEHPPLRRESLSLAVLNASLHYAGDLEATLQRIAETLQEGGWLIILDTPITQAIGPGEGPDAGLCPLQRPRPSLGYPEVKEALTAAGLCSHRVPVRRGPRWWIYQAKTWLKGDARFSFPMLVANRPE